MRRREARLCPGNASGKLKRVAIQLSGQIQVVFIAPHYSHQAGHHLFHVKPNGNRIAQLRICARKHDSAVSAVDVASGVDDHTCSPTLHAFELDRPESFDPEFFEHEISPFQYKTKLLEF